MSRKLESGQTSRIMYLEILFLVVYKIQRKPILVVIRRI
jgi:hypothetical protein